MPSPYSIPKAPYIPRRTQRSMRQKRRQKDRAIFRASYKASSTPPKEAYRGRPDQAPHIATMKTDGVSYTIAFPGLAEVVVHPPAGGIFDTKSTFMVKGKGFAWKDDRELRELESGTVLAKFDRKMFSTSKKGVMTISGVGVEMVDIVLLTGIAMQYQWEQLQGDL